MVNLEFHIDPLLILMSLYPVCYNTVLARGNGWAMHGSHGLEQTFVMVKVASSSLLFEAQIANE